MFAFELRGCSKIEKKTVVSICRDEIIYKLLQRAVNFHRKADDLFGKRMRIVYLQS